MKKCIQKLSLLALLTAAVAILPVQTHAEDKPAMEQPAVKPKSTPFKGKVTAIDKTAMTLSVGQRVFQVTSETKITKDGKPAILNDAAVGDNVGGAYKKTDDGKMNATTINLGMKPEKPAKPAKKAAEEM